MGIKLWLVQSFEYLQHISWMLHVLQQNMHLFLLISPFFGFLFAHKSIFSIKKLTMTDQQHKEGSSTKAVRGTA